MSCCTAEKIFTKDKCQDVNCNNEAYYNYIGIKKASYCRIHKLNGMIIMKPN